MARQELVIADEISQTELQQHILIQSHVFAVRTKVIATQNAIELIARNKAQLVISPALDVSRGRPPKPRWLIRMVLERIHRLVTGSAR